MLKRSQPARLLAVSRNVEPGTRLVLLRWGETAVGSLAANGLRISHDSVSDRHAVITYKRGRYFVKDLRSAQRTLLNGRRVRRKRLLRHGDNLRFGSAVPYRFIDPDAPMRRFRQRMLRAGLAASMLAVGVIAHAEKWDGGLLAPANIASIVVRAKSAVVAMVSWPAAPSGSVQATATPIPFPGSVATITAPPKSATVSGAARSARSPGLAHVAAARAPPPAVVRPGLAGEAWLDRINHYRAMCRLGALRENPKTSASVTAHAHYLLANFAANIRNGTPIPDAYDENRSRPGYTPGGAAQAPNSRLAWGCGSLDLRRAIDRWVANPFTRLSILNPDAGEVSFGTAVEGGCWVAALRLPPPAEKVGLYPAPVEFPPASTPVSLGWTDFASPDPLTGCPGYAPPVGLPITIQLGYLEGTKLSAHSLTRYGKPIDHCAFDDHSYVNPNSEAQEYGRWLLDRAGAVVIIPRSPLQQGRYTVSITAHEQTYKWTIEVGAGAQSASSH